MNSITNPFDRGPNEAVSYDAWYESSLGRAVLDAERRCIGQILEDSPHPWLDLGTGSGRFGGAIGADVGLDPARDLLAIAASRIPSVIRGVAQALPFRDASIGAVLAVTVFEFLLEPSHVMREISRLLLPGGRFVLGFFPRTGPWAAVYEEQGRDPESVFHNARFYTAEDIAALAASAGLRIHSSRSTLFEMPGTMPSGKISEGADASAGFVALALVTAT